MAGAVLPLSWGRASVLYSVQRFCMLSGGAPFVARLRFMFLLGFPLPHYPFLWPLPLFLFYVSGLTYKDSAVAAAGLQELLFGVVFSWSWAF